MREYARLKEVQEGDARELRQLSITSFLSKAPVEIAPRLTEKNLAIRQQPPPDTIWEYDPLDLIRKATWAGDLDAEVDPFVPRSILDGLTVLLQDSEPAQQGTTADPGLLRVRRARPFPWTGLNWFSLRPPIAPSLTNPLPNTL